MREEIVSRILHLPGDGSYGREADEGANTLTDFEMVANGAPVRPSEMLLLP